MTDCAPDPIFMLDLEERLHADRSGELRREIVERLRSMHAALLVQRRQLNEREVYLQIQAALSAVEGAIRAMHALRVKEPP